MMDEKKKKGRKSRESTKITQVFSQRLSDLVDNERNETGLRHNAIAEKIGVPPSSLTEWCYDYATPTIDYIVLLANYFNVSTDYLLGISDDKTRNPSAVNDLHLSMQAISTLESQKNDVHCVLNSLLESDSFPKCLQEIQRSIEVKYSELSPVRISSKFVREFASALGLDVKNENTLELPKTEEFENVLSMLGENSQNFVVLKKEFASDYYRQQAIELFNKAILDAQKNDGSLYTVKIHNRKTRNRKKVISHDK